MDRGKALEQLEVVRSDSDDLSDPELADAITALDDDPQARQEFDRRLQLDAKIAATMSAVEVPPELRQQLLTAIANQPVNQTASETAEPTAPARPAAPKSRRTLLKVSIAAAALVLAGIALYPRTATVAYDDIVNMAPRDAATVLSLAATAGNEASMTDLKLPLLLERKKATRIAWPSPNRPLAGQTKPTSVVLAGRGWVLVVTDRKKVIDTRDWDKAGTTGGTLDAKHAYRAWQDKEFVYVLFVRGKKQQLDAIYAREFGAATA